MTYQEFINNIINTRGRFNCLNEYHERHHIIPKCMDGKDNEENPRAKKIQRLSDNKIYNCILDAAEDNHVNRCTITDWIKKEKGFIFYTEK